MNYVTTHEAKTHLSKMLREVRSGKEFVIMNGREPVGKLIAFSTPTADHPKVGTITSPDTWVAEDAFEPLSDTQLNVWGL